MKVSDIMSKKPVMVLPTAQLRDLWQLLFKRQINAIIVSDKNEKLIGLVTKDDLLHILYPDYAEYIADFTSASDFEEMEKRVGSVLRQKTADIMCKKVIFTRPETMAMRALSRMIVRHVNQLPVVDDQDKVVGILTKGDVFYALFKREVRKDFAASRIKEAMAVRHAKKNVKKA